MRAGTALIYKASTTSTTCSLKSDKPGGVSDTGCTFLKQELLIHTFKVYANYAENDCLGYGCTFSGSCIVKIKNKYIF